MRGKAWVEINSGADIRQGDVVKKLASSKGESSEYAVVITADCDIAKKKTNNRMTIVRTVVVHEFVKKYWCAWELEKIATKETRQIVPFLQARMRSIDPQIAQLTPDRLKAWVLDRTPEEIFDILDISQLKSKKEYAVLKAIHIWAKFSEDLSDSDGLRALVAVRDVLGRSKSDLQTSISLALGKDEGFQDFLVIPNCPDGSGDGLVVLTREVMTLPLQDVFIDSIAARLADRQEVYYRIGRLVDRVKYGVAQRLAFVFSRIGMEGLFEEDRQTLADLVSLETL